MIALLAHRQRELAAPRPRRSHTMGFLAGVLLGAGWMLIWALDLFSIMNRQHRAELEEMHDLHNELLVEILCDPRLRFSPEV